MSDSMPGSALGYSLEVTEACEQALVTVLGCMGSLKETVRLVGGLAPRCLPPQGDGRSSSTAVPTTVSTVPRLLSRKSEVRSYEPAIF